jgi:hypothetical protein
VVGSTSNFYGVHRISLDCAAQAPPLSAPPQRCSSGLITRPTAPPGRRGRRPWCRGTWRSPQPAPGCWGLRAPTAAIAKAIILWGAGGAAGEDQALDRTWRPADDLRPSLSVAPADHPLSCAVHQHDDCNDDHHDDAARRDVSDRSRLRRREPLHTRRLRERDVRPRVPVRWSGRRRPSKRGLRPLA